MSDKLLVVDDLEWSSCTLQELCQRIALEEHFIVHCVQQGIAEVSGLQPDWLFSTTAALRIRKAWRLHRDLEVHLDNLVLTLELLDERDQLLQGVATLRQRLAHWEKHA